MAIDSARKRFAVLNSRSGRGLYVPPQSNAVVKRYMLICLYAFVTDGPVAILVVIDDAEDRTAIDAADSRYLIDVWENRLVTDEAEIRAVSDRSSDYGD